MNFCFTCFETLFLRLYFKHISLRLLWVFFNELILLTLWNVPLFFGNILCLELNLVWYDYIHISLFMLRVSMLCILSIIWISHLLSSLCWEFSPVNNVELGLALIFYCLLFHPVQQLLSFNQSVYFMHKGIADMVRCRSSFSTCFSVFVFCLFPSVSLFLLLSFLSR